MLANITYNTPALNCGWALCKCFLPSIIERSLSHTRSVLSLPLLRAIIRGEDPSPRGSNRGENRNNITLNIYNYTTYTSSIFRPDLTMLCRYSIPVALGAMVPIEHQALIYRPSLDAFANHSTTSTPFKQQGYHQNCVKNLNVYKNDILPLLAIVIFLTTLT